METTCKKRLSKAAVTLLIIVLASLTVLPACSGCFFFFGLTSMEFKNPSMELDLGETYTVTMSDIEFKPAMATGKEFTMTSANEGIVRVAGKSITAVGTGSTTVTATAESNFEVYCSMTVTVGYATPTKLSLKISGEKAQYVGRTSTVRFTVEGDVELDPSNHYSWTVNGEQVVGNDGADFYFTPDDSVGEYIVGVAHSGFGLSASSTVRVFSKEVENAAANYVGETLQDSVYTPITFTAAWEKTDGDPDPFVEWYVGDDKRGDGKTFEFTPPYAGSFIVTATVNGKPIKIGGASNVEITARGSIIPTNVSVDFNNIYPKISVSWSCPHNENMNYQVKIENISTGKVNDSLTSTNISAAALFDGTTFSAGSQLDIEKYSYRISVRSLGDGDVFLPSEYSAPVTVEKLPYTAVQYLKNKILDGTKDYYVVSDEEFADLMAYHMAFRKNSDSFNFSAYMAYTSQYTTAKQLGNMAFDYGATTGSYSTMFSGDTKKGSTVSVRISCNNSVAPSVSGGKGAISALNALEPHVAKSSRTSSHVFEMDKITSTQSVENSEELFRAAEFGVRPIPKSGSAADRLYTFAKRLLLEIISDDMTDAEKVHAIYDWIMWNVSYDHEAASSSSASDSALFKSYFLESVLTNESPYAVCDGMSKALSLLCRMEGIEAYRVTGTAGDSIAGLSATEANSIKSTWGGHAWNKVKVDGKWYVVDATWGDVAAQVSTSLRGTKMEMALHDWLLVADDDIYDTHAYDSIVHNPDTAKKRYDVYENMTYEYISNNAVKTADCYISVGGDEMSDEIRGMMECLSYMKKNSTRSVKIGNKEVVRSYVAMEISASDNMMNTFMNAAKATGTNNPFRRYLSSLGYRESDYIIRVFSTSVVVMLKI